MSNLKPFNLERALAGDPVVTRNGRPVTQIHNFSVADDPYSLRGVVDETIKARTPIMGKAWLTGAESAMDLFMAPKTRTVWVNLYPSECSLISGDYVYHESEEAADSNASASSPRLGNKAYPIEIEE